MTPTTDLLLPRPRRATASGATLALPPRASARLEGLSAEDPALRAVVARLAGLGCRLEPEGAHPPLLRLHLEPGEPAPEGYRLRVGEDSIEVWAAAPVGLAHALRTLAQWLALHALEGAPRGRIAGLVVEDAPALAERGAMLDVARDRVPTMARLFALVERLASLKLNRLQLYMEASFAYSRHEEVWRDASPFTAEELRALDAFCRARFVELVPNQQSLGHMHRWLVHPRYRELAECPDGVEHPFAFEREPFSLCPTDPRALALLEELYDELLPCFTARALNVGLDETFDLGLGRSRAACEARGKARVYLEHVRALHERLAARGVRMQLWGDIVLEHPELIPELPPDVTLMAWGYDAAHPFERELPRFAASGLAFHVCPGTSSWNSVGGRTDNALVNLERAARAAHAHGARGLLVTDWGDRGHLQPPSVSWLGWLAGAEAAWRADEPPARGAPAWQRALDHHAFEDAAGVLGRAAWELGRVEHASGARSTNGTALFYLLAFAGEPLPHPRIDALSDGGLARAEEAIAAALSGLERARPAVGEPAARELRFAGDLLGASARLGRARLAAGPGRALAELPSGTRAALAGELEALLERHRALWLESSRPGGLERSCAWIARAVGGLRAGRGRPGEGA